MIAKKFTEKSEIEIELFLRQRLGENDIEVHPKVGDKYADFLIRSIDTYIEVHAIKNIAMDQLIFTLMKKGITHFRLKENGQKRILDRIAYKLLNECTQLPEGKMNLIITKAEGFFVSPDDVIDSIIGEPLLVINRENMQTTVQHGKTAFRTEEELQHMLQKISAIIAYKRICEHGKLQGVIGDNKNNAKAPFEERTFKFFKDFLCDKCE